MTREAPSTYPVHHIPSDSHITLDTLVSFQCFKHNNHVIHMAVLHAVPCAKNTFPLACLWPAVPIIQICV